jgi:hypothetical protein
MVIIHESVKNGSVIRVKYKDSISYRNPAKFARSIVGTGNPVIPGSSGVVVPLGDSLSPLFSSTPDPPLKKDRGAAHGVILGPGPLGFSSRAGHVIQEIKPEAKGYSVVIDKTQPSNVTAGDDKIVEAVSHGEAQISQQAAQKKYELPNRITIKEGKITRPLLNQGIITDMPKTPANSTSQTNITAVKRILRVLRQITLLHPPNPKEGWPYGRGASVQQIHQTLVSQRHLDYSEVFISNVLKRSAAQATVRLLPNGNYVLNAAMGQRKMSLNRNGYGIRQHSYVHPLYRLENKKPQGEVIIDPEEGDHLNQNNNSNITVTISHVPTSTVTSSLVVSTIPCSSMSSTKSGPPILQHYPPPPTLTPGVNQSLHNNQSINMNFTAPQLKKIEPRVLRAQITPSLPLISPINPIGASSSSSPHTVKSLLTSSSTELSAAGRYLAHQKRQAANILDKKKRKEDLKALRMQERQQQKLQRQKERQDMKEHRRQMRQMQYAKQQAEKHQSFQNQERLRVQQHQMKHQQQQESSCSSHRGRPVSKRKKFKKNLGPDFVEPVQYLKSVEFEPKCDHCSSSAAKNTRGRAEELLVCKDCSFKAHPSCLQYSVQLAKKCRESPWQCMYCKDCCKCDGSGDVESILFCDACDKGYHMHCHEPKIRVKPQGTWICSSCLNEKKRKTGRTESSSSKGKTPSVLDDDEDDKSSSVASEPLNQDLSSGKKSKVKKVIVESSKGIRVVKKKGNWKGYALVEESDDDNGDQGEVDDDKDETSVYRSNRDDTSKILSMLKPSLDKLSTRYPGMTLNPSEWSPEEVENFIHFVGFTEEAVLFRDQEIDGMSLLLFKRTDVLDHMPMKLGPALKIYGHIQRLQMWTPTRGKAISVPSPLTDMNSTIRNGHNVKQNTPLAKINELSNESTRNQEGLEVEDNNLF